MPFTVDDVVRLPDADEPDAPVPLLLRGRYARVRETWGESCSLVIYTWRGTVVPLDFPTRWLKSVPPEERARFEFIKRHLASLPGGPELKGALSDAKTTLHQHLLEVTGQGVGVDVWLCDTPFDAIRALGKNQENLSEAQKTLLQSDWGVLVRAANLLHEAVLRYTRS